MKTKLAQFVSFLNKFDPRYIQTAYFALAVVGYIVLRAPSDGGTGPF
jgi:hypothetical protein